MDCLAIVLAGKLYLACVVSSSTLPISRPAQLPEAITYHDTDILARLTPEEYINITSWASACNDTINRYEELFRPYGGHNDNQHPPERD